MAGYIVDLFRYLSGFPYKEVPISKGRPLVYSHAMADVFIRFLAQPRISKLAFASQIIDLDTWIIQLDQS